MLLGGNFLGRAAVADPGLPRLETLVPEAVFLPQGFDNNDNAQLVVYGTLSDSCFRLGPVDFKVDLAARTIRVRSQVYVYDSDWCLPIISPVTQTVDLGVLPANDYRIEIETETGDARNFGSLPIQASTNAGPDDFLYGEVNDLVFEPNAVGGGKLTLRGTLGAPCMELKEVKVFYRGDSQGGARVMEVLPIAGALPTDRCAEARDSFERVIELKTEWKGLSLIHVRSQNGQSINRVVQL